MKMRSQIVLAQVPTAIIISLLTIFFIYALTLIKQKSEVILVVNFKSILSMQKFNEWLEELNYNTTINPETFQTDLPKIKELENKIEQQLILQEKNVKEPAEEAELTKELRQKWEVYKVKIQSTPPDKLKDNTEYFNKLYREIKYLTTNIIGLNQDALVRNKEGLSTFISNFLMFIVFGSAISLIFGFSMSWFFTGLFLSPLKEMTDIMSQVGKEEKTTFLHIKGSEEIEQLSNEFNLMTSRLEEYHRSSLGQVMQNYHTLKVTFDVIPDPILILDHTNNIIFVNQAAQTHLEFSGDLKTSTPLLLTSDELRETLTKISNKVLLTKTPYLPEKAEDAIPIPKKHKKTFFLPWAYPIKKSAEDTVEGLLGVVIILQDLMRQPLSEIGKTDVYQTLIQEFQSPLSDVHMAIYVCEQGAAGPLTEKQQEILYSASEKCDTLEKLCQDLLNFSQLNQKAQILEQENIDLSEVVSFLIPSLHIESYQKGISIEVDKPLFLPKIKGNVHQIDILIGNLIRNAIQYADPGTTVKIKIAEKDNFIRFSVTNKGILIPPEHLDNIFKKYFKVPAQTQEGPGLGLYIAKQLIEALGGKIGCTSTETQGTTIWFVLPASSQTSGEEESQED